MELTKSTVLSNAQKSALRRGGILTVSDLVLNSFQEVSKKAKITPVEAKNIIDAVCKDACPTLRRLKDVQHEGSEMFTTGDSNLDAALGGGLRTGMVWEVAGESAAGKTQVALQVSLFVQLPEALGGLSGSACYITTSSKLPTTRLLQIAQTRPSLASSDCSLEYVHTMSTPTIGILIRALSQLLPSFIQEKAQDPHSRPVKLLVIDALAELFHSSEKTSMATLVERSKDIAEVATNLHALATTHQIAVLVLNEVVDAFYHGNGGNVTESTELVYSEQSQWFSRGHSVPGENKKEASLGLVWANQINARILLSRTGRRRYLDLGIPANKRRKVAEDTSSAAAPNSTAELDQATLIRRLSVIFSSVAPPVSLDYIVTESGITVLPSDDYPPSGAHSPLRTSDAPAPVIPETMISQTIVPSSQSQVAPLDWGFAESEREPDVTQGLSSQATPEEDEWDKYWEENEMPDGTYENLDWEALERGLPSSAPTDEKIP